MGHRWSGGKGCDASAQPKKGWSGCDETRLKGKSAGGKAKALMVITLPGI